MAREAAPSQQLPSIHTEWSWVVPPVETTTLPSLLAETRSIFRNPPAGTYSIEGEPTVPLLYALNNQLLELGCFALVSLGYRWCSEVTSSVRSLGMLRPCNIPGAPFIS